nr:hypothetical protein [Candidatus Krumholzibacteriota bacterium]
LPVTQEVASSSLVGPVFIDRKMIENLPVFISMRDVRGFSCSIILIYSSIPEDLKNWSALPLI